MVIVKKMLELPDEICSIDIGGIEKQVYICKL